jgi:nitrate reductase gamma subunit
MRDHIVFGVAPWIAAFSFVVTGAIRYVRSPRDRAPHEVGIPRIDATEGVSAWWRSSMTVVFLGHVLAIAFPGALLLWNRQPIRLIALESLGLIAAVVALASLVAAAIQRKWWSHHRYMRSPFDVIAATLVLLELVSGVAMAMRYRWASSWSAVTLAPYLRSLASLQPSTGLVAHMPLVVKLHVVCAFALFAVVPLTTLAGTVAVLARDMVRVPIAPATSAWHPVTYSRGVRTGRIDDGEM